MRYIYSEEENPLATDYYYEASYLSRDYIPFVPTHTHNFYEIYIYLNGSMKLSIENTSYDVQKGDVIIIPPYTIHQLIRSGPDRLPYTRVLTYITEACLKTFQFNEYGLLDSLKLAQQNQKYHFKLENTDEFDAICRCMRKLNDNKNNRDFGAELLNRSYILQFMTLICRNIRKDLTPQNIIHINPLVERILSYINSNYNEDISLDSLKERFFINKSTLTKEFKNQTAQTIHSYLVMKRISVAKQEMANGIPPSQVYLLIGFKDYSTFYRTFQKLEGMSPKEFYKLCNRTE